LPDPFVGTYFFNHVFFRTGLPMKWFYFSALFVVGVLAAFPMFLLKSDTVEKHNGAIVYRLNYSADVKSIDPATCGDDMSSTIQGNFYEGLYAYHYLKRPLEVIPQLAASLPEISADGLTYTIRLKPGVLFHRNACFGRDRKRPDLPATRTVDAKDFVLAFKRVADYHINTGLAWAFIADRITGLNEYREKTRTFRIGDYSRYDLPVAGLQALDSLTFQISLTAPFPQFLYVLAMHVYAPIPRELVDYWLTSESDGRGGRRPLPVHERNPEIMDRAQVVGTGPYLLDENRRKWKIRLTRNPDFRPDFYPVSGQAAGPGYAGDSELGLLADAGKRLPFIDEVHFRYVDEQYTSWMLFLSKQLDVASIPRENFESVVRPDKQLTDQWKKSNIFLARTTEPAVYWIAFNMDDTILGPCRELRQAICLGYDVENEITVLMNGRGTRAVNIVPSDFKGHAEAGPGPYYHLDVAAAKDRVALAKKKLDKLGLLVKGEIPELRIDLSDGPYAQREAEYLRQQFSNIGLKIKVIYNDWPTLQRKVNNKQCQMYQMGWVADYPDAENFLQLFYSGNIDKGTNNANFRDHRYDSLYERIRVMQDSPERTAIYAAMVRILNEECPVMLLYEPEIFSLLSNWVKNFKIIVIGNGYSKYRRIDASLRQKEGGEY
jgi:oligopeptide transport system substrate-binding protein